MGGSEGKICVNLLRIGSEGTEWIDEVLRGTLGFVEEKRMRENPLRITSMS